MVCKNQCLIHIHPLIWDPSLDPLIWDSFLDPLFLMADLAMQKWAACDFSLCVCVFVCVCLCVCVCDI